MSERRSEFGPHTSIALITFTAAPLLGRYVEARRLAFPALIDGDRSVYRAYGLARASPSQIWTWSTIRRYIDILRDQGLGALHRPTEDTRQLGGDFVIAGDGALSFAFRSESPDDRPTVDQLIEAVRT